MNQPLQDNLILMNTDAVQAYFDIASKILYVTYKGELSSAVTSAFYASLMDAITNNPQEVMNAWGSIYDFRDVTKFISTNISTTMTRSKEVNRNADLANHPVALVVNSAYQEQMVGLMMKLSEQSTRKRLVRSVEDGLDFIEQWHNQNDE